MKQQPTDIRKKQQGGFTLVEIMIVIAIVGLLAVMAMPSYVRARDSAQVSSCINNLRQIDGAKDQYAIENMKVTGATVTDAHINPYLKTPFADMLEPAGGGYTIDVIGTSPSCDIGGDHAL